MVWVYVFLVILVFVDKVWEWVCGFNDLVCWYLLVCDSWIEDVLFVDKVGCI